LHAYAACAAGRPDDSSNNAASGHNRHIRLDAVSRPSAYSDRQHTGIRVSRDDVRGQCAELPCSSAASIIPVISSHVVPARAAPGGALRDRSPAFSVLHFRRERRARHT
jgi:hypothetical protein